GLAAHERAPKNDLVRMYSRQGYPKHVQAMWRTSVPYVVVRARSCRKNRSGLPRTPAAFMAFRRSEDFANFLARRRSLQRSRMKTSFGLAAVRNNCPPLHPCDFLARPCPSNARSHLG